MADIIDLMDRNDTRDNLITASPLEFRVGDRHTGHVMMCTKRESEKYEAHRREAFATPGHQYIAFLPNHFTLDGGAHYTIQGLIRHRKDEGLMRRVYRLAGLMECVTNVSSPILRTDLLRRVYKSILDEREALGVIWRGSVNHFLLPLHPDFHNPNLFHHNLSRAESLKALLQAIEDETNAQFDVLSYYYVFYLPDTLVLRG